MSPEHENPRPERRVFYTPPGPDAERVVREALSKLTDHDDALRLLAAFDGYGAGFAAHLLLNDTNVTDPDVERIYRDCYADAWQSLDDLATDTIEALGWREAVTDLVREHAIEEGALTWNPTALYGRLHQIYSFVELDGVIHAFFR